ncbi:unnamed protein product [Allacma fusca]|uniref:Uncharacterized protein n=1 Tax=Allacma fusca TaxID=39272 RepID=A0A8J2JUC5_9HEXA|nr:unnamed protein product [Allacma fusca]
MFYTIRRVLLAILVVNFLFTMVLGEATINPDKVPSVGMVKESLTPDENDEAEKQGPSTERNCIISGRACELLVQRRLCCSGNPCQIVPSQILQLFTLGGWGMCH